jgi:hypothetical protein
MKWIGRSAWRSSSAIHRPEPKRVDKPRVARAKRLQSGHLLSLGSGLRAADPDWLLTLKYQS